MYQYGSPWTGGLHESPFHEAMSTNPVAQDAAEGLAFYATAGAVDPKAPIIDVPLASRALQVGYWTAYGIQLPFAVVGSLVIGLVFDPAHKFQNWGLDEVWHHSYTDEPWDYDTQF